MDELFYGTRGPRDARIMIVAESWDVNEERKKQPLVGESGQLLHNLCKEVGLDESKILITNVVPERPTGNKMYRFFHKTKEARAEGRQIIRGLYPKDNVIQGLERLDALIEHVKPDIIIGFGNYSLWALTDDCFNIGNTTSPEPSGWKIPTGIGAWRGSQLYTRHGIRFVPTYHPAAALRQYSWRYQIRHDLLARVKKGDWDEPDYNFIIQPSLETVTSTLGQIEHMLNQGPMEVAVDVETRASTLACIGLGWSELDAICIPLMKALEPYNYWSHNEEAIVIDMLRRVLLHPNIRIIGQNFQYDAQYIYRFLLARVKVAFDTMLAQHVVFPGTELGLGYLSSMHSRFHRYWKDEGKEWTKNMDETQLWSYNCKDCCVTFEVAQSQKNVISYYKLEEQFDWQMRQLDELLTMMFRGVRVDRKVKGEMSLELLDYIANYATRIDNMLPEDVYPRPPKLAPWYNSNKQQREIFQDIFGLKPFFNRSKRKYTMDDQALEYYGKTNVFLKHLTDEMRVYNSLTTFRTFTEMQLDFDDRMRCQYSPTAETFRYRSSQNVFKSGGNLQNLPKGDEEVHLPNIRKQFIPDQGYFIVDADLAGADAQVVAWDADDADLKAAFRAGLKVHIKNARDMFGEEVKDYDDDEIKHLPMQHVFGSGPPGAKFYTIIKSGVHGTNYYGTANGMAPRLGLPLVRMEEFQERWFYLHPAIRDWHETTRMKLEGIMCWNCDTMAEGNVLCQSCGAQLGRTVRNAWGYRRVYFDRLGDNIDTILREALAWIAQSSVAINTERALIMLPKKFPFVQNLLQVHDSLVFQVPHKHREFLSNMKEAMDSIVTPYQDPLRIPWGFATSIKSWGDCE